MLYKNNICKYKYNIITYIYINKHFDIYIYKFNITLNKVE